MNKEIKFRVLNKFGEGSMGAMDFFSIEDFIDFSDETIEKIVQMKEGTPHMRYTGLKDSKGKEIYEGDIIRGRYTYEFDNKTYIPGEYPGDKKFSIKVVKWINKTEGDEILMGWYPLNYYSTNGCNDCDDEFYEIETCEVIGNIYENKELLK